MCGIAGFLTPGARSGHADLDVVLRSMTDAIRHRGPDDSGAWRDVGAGVWLGHRRLSILDLSEAGHQPMISPCGRYVLVFNGEIYNHLQIRDELDSSHDGIWRGHADTETLLVAFSRFGIRAALARTVGMFAFAVWDREARILTLARDRLGEKPLYYGWQDECFLFGSELKALRAHPVFNAQIDRDALTLLMRHNYIPAPHSIYKEIHKLQPGTLLEVSAGTREPRIESFWSPRHAVESALQDPFRGGPAEAIDDLEGLLRNAVGQQMVADVPLGAFLSGGVDSSVVVALMQAQSSRPVKTFAIGFNEAQYNEAGHAKAVARHLGTDHTELYVSPEEARAVIPRLPVLYDEPFSDSSQIPTFLVAQLARTEVAVSLSGDGGDELFGGYERYRIVDKLWRRLRRTPRPIRAAFAAGLRAVKPESWDRLFAAFGTLVATRHRFTHPGEKLHKLAEVLLVHDLEQIYHQLVSHWNDPNAVVTGGFEPPTVLADRKNWVAMRDFTQRMMYLDLVSYLPGDILTKLDRASMGVSLESRVPLLDHRVVEFAWRLPFEFKIRDGQTKWALRQVLYRHVPRKLIERPKMGFGVPIGTWLRGPLREWTETLLARSRLRQEGFLDPDSIRRKWAEHLSGERNWQYHLWDVLMFQAWLEAERRGP